MLASTNETERNNMLKAQSQIDSIFDNKVMTFACDSELMTRFRVSSFYAEQIELGRSELDAIGNAVRVSS